MYQLSLPFFMQSWWSQWRRHLQGPIKITNNVISPNEAHYMACLSNTPFQFKNHFATETRRMAGCRILPFVSLIPPSREVAMPLHVLLGQIFPLSPSWLNQSRIYPPAWALRGRVRFLRWAQSWEESNDWCKAEWGLIIKEVSVGIRACVSGWALPGVSMPLRFLSFPSAGWG